MFRYRLHSPDGDDLGEATYAMMIKPGEEIIVGNGERFRVLDVVPFEEEDESPFVGLVIDTAPSSHSSRDDGLESLVTVRALPLPASGPQSVLQAGCVGV